MDYKQRIAIKSSYKSKLKKQCPQLAEKSGIYIFYRNIAYVGKSKSKSGVLGRCADHCISHEQHIDNSLHSRKLIIDGGQWHVKPLIYCDDSMVDEYETHFIDEYQKKGYELYNVESGGTTGKTLIAEKKQSKGYNRGKTIAHKQVWEEIAPLFQKGYLKVEINGKDGVLKQRALERFNNFINKKESE